MRLNARLIDDQGQAWRLRQIHRKDGLVCLEARRYVPLSELAKRYTAERPGR